MRLEVRILNRLFWYALLTYGNKVSTTAVRTIEQAWAPTMKELGYELLFS
jgi:hypothetical protein